MIEVRKRPKSQTLQLCGDTRDGEVLTCLKGRQYRPSATKELFLHDHHFGFCCDGCAREYRRLWDGLL